MSFRQFGGLNYAARHNIVSSNYNTSNNLLVTQNVGQPNSYINFLSDISGNISIFGDLDVCGNVTANEFFIKGPVIDVPNSVVPKSYVDAITLAQVLTAGNSAGTNDINMNNKNILNVNNMNVTTINGIPYPPPSANFTLTTITNDTSPLSIPSGVKYIVVTLTGGGGGAGRSSGNGSNSTFILNETTLLTAAGGSKNDNGGDNPGLGGATWDSIKGYPAPNNSGAGGMSVQAIFNSSPMYIQGLAGQTISAGYVVTSEDTYQVTIGSGGIGSGGGNGGSGIAYITMYS